MTDFFDDIENIETKDMTVIKQPYKFVLMTMLYYSNSTYINDIDELISKAKTVLVSRLKNLMFKNTDIAFESDIRYTTTQREDINTEKICINVYVCVDAYGSLDKTSVQELVSLLDVIFLCSNFIYRNERENVLKKYTAFIEYTDPDSNTEKMTKRVPAYLKIISSIIQPNYSITEEVLYYSRCMESEYNKYSIWNDLIKNIKKDNSRNYKIIRDKLSLDRINHTYPSDCGFEKLLYGLFDNDVTVMLNISPWSQIVKNLFGESCFSPMFEIFTSTFLSTIITQQAPDFKYDENDTTIVHSKGYYAPLEIIDPFVTAPLNPNERHLSNFCTVFDAYSILKRNKKKICHPRRDCNGKSIDEFVGLVFESQESDIMDVILSAADFYDKDTKQLYSLNVRFCGSIKAVKRAISEFIY